MPTTPRVSVVIPIYGQVQLLRLCLAALERAGLDGVELVLVDNASPDDTPSLLAEMDGRAVIIRNRRNEGFARACNRGVEAASAPVVVLLNTDTEVQPGWLEPLLEELDDPTVGAAGSRLLYPDGRVQHAGMGLLPGGAPWHLHRGLPGDHPLVCRSRDVTMVTGACLAMRRDRYLRAGGLDTEYVNGFEDCDLCLRVARDGLRIRYRADSVVIHHEGKSTGRREQEDENRLKFRRAWGTHPHTVRGFLMDDGLVGDHIADCAWTGPLFDGTPAADLGLRCIAALADAGLHPCITEINAGDCPRGTGTDVPPQVVAALNRCQLSVVDPITFHHETGGHEWAGTEPTWPVVVVADPGAAAPQRPFPRLDLVLVAGDGITAIPGPHATFDPASPDLVEPLCDHGLDPHRTVGITWVGAAMGRSGYARAGRGLLTAGATAGIPIALSLLDRATEAETPQPVCARVVSGAVVVVHSLPVGVDGDPVWSTVASAVNAPFIGATCFESTTLPPTWVRECNTAMEVWVPTAFNRRTFTAAGVDPDLLHCVPYPVDTDEFTPSWRPVEDDGPFTFLSVFEWTWRKGWDVLLDAYTAEFSADEPVRLLLLTYRGPGAMGAGGVLDQAGAFLQSLGRDPDGVADIELALDPISTPALINLYRRCGAFVLPTRGEGAGMPVLEAAACGAPVIATAWGGHEELMEPELAFPVEVRNFVVAPDELLRDNPLYQGQFLADPDPMSLRAAMRSAYEDRAGARARAARAREVVVERFGIDAAGRAMRERVDAHLERLGRPRPRAVRAR